MNEAFLLISVGPSSRIENRGNTSNNQKYIYNGSKRRSINKSNPISTMQRK